MKIIKLTNAGTNYLYRWPEGYEHFKYYVDYKGVSAKGLHDIRVSLSNKQIYDRFRERIMVWIDQKPYAEFVSVDDFENSGELLSQIRILKNSDLRMCRYPMDTVPQRYGMFTITGFPVRINAPRVHRAWGVLANIADHKTMISLAALRMYELRQLALKKASSRLESLGNTDSTAVIA